MVSSASFCKCNILIWSWRLQAAIDELDEEKQKEIQELQQRLKRILEGYQGRGQADLEGAIKGLELQLASMTVSCNTAHRDSLDQKEQVPVGTHESQESCVADTEQASQRMPLEPLRASASSRHTFNVNVGTRAAACLAVFLACMCAAGPVLFRYADSTSDTNMVSTILAKVVDEARWTPSERVERDAGDGELSGKAPEAHLFSLGEPGDATALLLDVESGGILMPIFGSDHPHADKKGSSGPPQNHDTATSKANRESNSPHESGNPQNSAISRAEKLENNEQRNSSPVPEHSSPGAAQKHAALAATDVRGTRIRVLAFGETSNKTVMPARNDHALERELADPAPASNTWLTEILPHEHRVSQAQGHLSHGPQTQDTFGLMHESQQSSLEGLGILGTPVIAQIPRNVVGTNTASDAGTNVTVTYAESLEIHELFSTRDDTSHDEGSTSVLGNRNLNTAIASQGESFRKRIAWNRVGVAPFLLSIL
jgi:hypothetical protein